MRSPAENTSRPATFSFVEVTDPKNPVLIGTLPTRGTPDYVLWRDIKVDGHYAYIDNFRVRYMLLFGPDV